MSARLLQPAGVPMRCHIIDAGSEDATTQSNLIAYLTNFFARRTDLNNTLDLVILSHDHIDHDFALKAVAQKFHIKNFIDNGHTAGSGQKNQGWTEQNMKTNGGGYESISYDLVTANGNTNGLNDKTIEPLHCSVITPAITVLSGSVKTPPSYWKATDLSNENNHSVVVRVTYGQASFLFTGDLETAGDSLLINEYGDTGLLHADLWKVSHHGAVNGTNASWVNTVAPKYAVISCGQWNDGQNSKSKFNTYHYGHPRVSTLQFLSNEITGNRAPLNPIVAFTGITTAHQNFTVTKNIYCTAWDGNITISATPDGQYQVVTNDQ